MGEVVAMKAVEAKLRVSKATRCWVANRGMYEDDDDWMMFFYGYCYSLCRDNGQEAMSLSAVVAENMQEPRLSVSPSARDGEPEIYIEIDDPEGFV